MSTGNSTQTTTQSSEIANAALPYVKQGLGSASALLERPYQAYQGQQVAGFTPLQQQSFESAQNMAPSQLSGVAGLSALGAGQNYMNMATNPMATQAFMSPYQQGVIDVAQRNAMRNASIAGLGRNAAAVKSGAFGGSRQAIENAEANRNLQQQLSDIQTQGLQSAYDKAQQNMQYGSNLGLQGAQAAGTLGGQLFQQGMDINKLQGTYGTQQQANVQSALDKGYQQFQEEQQYPYKNLAFLSDMYRGLPLSGTTSSATTAPAPSLLSQIGGLGLAAYGLNKRAGGKIEEPKGYAGGGMVAFSAGGKATGLETMPIERLQKAVLGQDPQIKPFQALAELQRRSKNIQMQQAAQAAQNAEQSQGTVAGDRINQADYLSHMVQSENPYSAAVAAGQNPVMQNPVGMFGGGTPEDATKEVGYTSEDATDEVGYTPEDLGLGAYSDQAQDYEAVPTAATYEDTGLGKNMRSYLATKNPEAYADLTDIARKYVEDRTVTAPAKRAKELGVIPGASKAVAKAAKSSTGAAAPIKAAVKEEVKADKAATTAESDDIKSLRDLISARRKAIEDSKEEAKRDAVVTAGLAIAGGSSPYFLSNIGAGGLKGVEAYKAARDADRAENLKLLGDQADIAKLVQQGRTQEALAKYQDVTGRAHMLSAEAAMVAAKNRGLGGAGAALAGDKLDITTLHNLQTNLTSQLNSLKGQYGPQVAQQRAAIQAQLDQVNNAMMGRLGGTIKPVAPSAPAAGGTRPPLGSFNK